MKGLKRSPHEELTDARNERILGTLTPRSWHMLSVLATRAKFYDMDIDPAELEHPMLTLVEEARQSSGSIRGEHRKDLVDAIKGAQPQNVGLSLTGQAPSGAASGNGQAPPKRAW